MSESKPGHKTTELGVALASMIGMYKMGLDSEDPIMNYIAMGGLSLIASVYIWSRTKVKGYHYDTGNTD